MLILLLNTDAMMLMAALYTDVPLVMATRPDVNGHPEY
jgi:hypothetical protein